MKIYLAGKISKQNDWREEILGQRPGGVMWDDYLSLGYRDAWPEIPIKSGVMAGHTYVGPFFIGCDHGGYHGPNSHGVGIDDFGGHGGVAACCAGESTEPDRGAVTRLCLGAMSRSDLVFAWLDDPTAYGTIAEVAWASGLILAHHKIMRVVVSAPERVPEDLWFVTHMPNVQYEPRGSSPSEALRRLIEPETHFLASASKCQSPIEIEMLRALLSVAQWTYVAADHWECGHYTLKLQHEVSCNGRSYRLDFALLWGDRVCAIECDGHSFHERTKEQAQRDKRRDRDMAAMGWTVLRFTGSEIYQDAKACAVEVADLIIRWADPTWVPPKHRPRIASEGHPS